MEKAPRKPAKAAKPTKEARLAAALKRNIARRKAAQKPVKQGD